MPPAPGLLLGGRYCLESRLAGGGMGEVWQAVDTLLDRAVAVKLPRPGLADDPAFGDRLLEEARHAAAVVHRGIAAVYDVHAVGPMPFLVLELVEGRPLSRLLAEQGPLPPERARRIICQVADALAAAHAAGLVHRDVKPANLLVTADDTVKVTDFGISRATDAAAVTGTGFVVGTAQYLSPEQAWGRPATPASDLYALGVVAFECLAGRRPFDGDPLAVLLAHREEPVPDVLPHVPDDLRRLVFQLLDKDPERRPSAAQVVGAAPPPSPPPPPPSAPPAVPQARRHVVSAVRTRPRLALAGVGALAGLVLLAAVPGLGSGGGAAPARAEAGEVDAPATPPVPLPVAATTLFHPGGSGRDHPEEVPLAVDGDPQTAWTTQRYDSPAFGSLRPGVGLLLDLGEPRAVREVRLSVGTPGLGLRVHAGAAPDPTMLESPALYASPSAPAQVAAAPGEPVTAQFFVVWIDRLPASGRRHQAALSEISLLG